MSTEMRSAVVRQRAAGVNMSVDVDVLGTLLNVCVRRADLALPRIDTLTIEPVSGDLYVKELRVFCREGTPVEGATLDNLSGAADAPRFGSVLAWLYVRPEPNEWGHHWLTDDDIRLAYS